jgi:hypothetical protein
MSWTTLLVPEMTRDYMGDKELHSAWFVPKGWPVVIVNQPGTNKNIKYWTRSACKRARQYRACLSFACDTAEQIEEAAKVVGKILPNYERVALERMYRPETRVAGKLS